MTQFRSFILEFVTFVSLNAFVWSDEPQQVVIVTTDNALVKVGAEVLARLPQGERLTVTKTQGEWFYVRAKVAGHDVEGWLHQNQVGKQSALSETDQSELQRAKELNDQVEMLVY